LSQTRYYWTKFVFAVLGFLVQTKKNLGVCMASDPDNKKELSRHAQSGPVNSIKPAPAPVWAAMSHEIRTPLTGILGTLEVLASTSLTDEQRGMIATAEKSSEALMRIVDDVLDLARLEVAAVALEERPSNVADLIEDCAESLANQADAKGLLLTCETDTQIPAVICDPVRLRQVLTNLTVNAIKFTDTGHVALSVSLIEILGSRANIRFAVEDSGSGIPEELMTFLFKPFSQIKDTGTRGSGGVGLGLAICRALVEAMGGKIRIESKLGQGAKFTVDLPFNISPGELQTSRCRPLADDDLSIVAVSTEDPAVQIAVRYLRDAGANVNLVGSMTELSSSECGLSAARPPVIVLGPDAEQTEVEAVSGALQKMQLRTQPLIVWLYPRAVGGALSFVCRGIRTLRAYPLRRAALISAVLDAHQLAPGVDQALTFKRHFQTASHSADATEMARAEGRVVLIAEDNPVNQQVLSQQLGILGVPCDVAGNGNTALQLMEEHSYILLLCDCHMPGMDGLELTRIVREREKETGAHLPIIAVTANALPGEAERCRAAGMDDYLAKPIEIKNLRSAMERWIELPRDDRSTINGIVPDKFSSEAEPTSQDLEASQHDATTSQDQLVDLRNLQILYGEDEARLSAVLNQWTRVITEAAGELRSALKRMHREHAIEAVHRLKGSAGIAGAQGLSAAAAELENALRTNDQPQIKVEGIRVLGLAKRALDDVAAWKAARLSGVNTQAAS
jgi:two-component system, sensor histidine kinase and response regulator